MPPETVRSLLLYLHALHRQNLLECSVEFSAGLIVSSSDGPGKGAAIRNLATCTHEASRQLEVVDASQDARLLGVREGKPHRLVRV